METVIHPDIFADEILRPVVERANTTLERMLALRAPDRAVWRKEADEFGQPLIRLEFSYQSVTRSRHFRPDELESPQTAGVSFRELFRDVLAAAMTQSYQRIVQNLREWREEQHTEDTAKHTTVRPTEAH